MKRASPILLVLLALPSLAWSSAAVAQGVGDSLPGVPPAATGADVGGDPRRTEVMPTARDTLAPPDRERALETGAAADRLRQPGAGADTLGARIGVADTLGVGVEPTDTLGLRAGGAAQPADGGAPGAPPAATGLPTGARGTGADVPAEERPLPIPEKPPLRQYRLGAVGSAFAWDEDASADDGLLAGFEVERDVASFLAVRAGLGYGTTEFADTSTTDAADVRLYLPELTVLLQPALGPFESLPFVPYALVGFGSLITDPDREGFTTRSQNAFGYGVGGRFRLGSRLGVRGEVERYLVKLEDLFDSAAREGRSVHNTRFGGSLTYAF